MFGNLEAASPGLELRAGASFERSPSPPGVPGFSYGELQLLEPDLSALLPHSTPVPLSLIALAPVADELSSDLEFLAPKPGYCYSCILQVNRTSLTVFAFGELDVDNRPSNPSLVEFGWA